MTYNPGQVQVLFKHIDKRNPPDWFILGGPADADEAQCFVKRYPNCKVIAVEPSIEMVNWQLANGFPLDGVLINAGLNSHSGTLEFSIPSGSERRSSAVRACGGSKRIINAITLDQLSRTYGPFTNAVLWLDIEGMEASALQGASHLFASGEVKLVTLEILTKEQPESIKFIEDFMASRGYKLVEVWDKTAGNHEDRIYVK